VKGGAYEAHRVVDDPSRDDSGCYGPLCGGPGQANKRSADAKCAKLAIKTLGPSFNPSNYTFFGGNEVSNEFSGVKTEGPDVFCGFGGPDFISSGPSFISLDAGDIFLGGEGDDSVTSNEQGATFNGEAGNDFVEENGGRFVGGEGCDDVMFGDDPVDPPEGSCTI
jgi:hypothetical protein